MLPLNVYKHKTCSHVIILFPYWKKSQPCLLYLEKNESGIHVKVCLEVENLQIFNKSQLKWRPGKWSQMLDISTILIILKTVELITFFLQIWQLKFWTDNPCNSYNLGHKGWEKIILYTSCPSPPLCNVEKTLFNSHKFAFYHLPTLKGGLGVLTFIL